MACRTSPPASSSPQRATGSPGLDGEVVSYNPPMRRFALALIFLVALPVGSALAGAGWPSRSTPLGSTLGWFKAINEHNRQRLLFYVARSARSQMGWATPTAEWSKFTDLHCRSLKTSSSNVGFLCRFHESSSPTEGNPSSGWRVQLHRFKRSWLIVSYGQG